MSNLRVLAGYRSILRATRTAFNADIATLIAARDQIKREMKSSVSKSQPMLNIEERTELLFQISSFLKQNIVQGVKNGKDEGKDKYLLNIHKDTELGDNDDIKKKNELAIDGSSMNVGGCCGGGQVKLEPKN
ncbi:Mzm1 protein [Martiniozyma asiatica (nom. inval.)]|nr:Mzm1 protein [Martiniozyma asiatica]